MLMLALDEAPDIVRDELLRELDGCWGRRSPDGRAATAEAAEQRMREGFGYLLRMYWLGRSDKFSRELRPVLSWVTGATLPAEVLARDSARSAGEPEIGRVRFAGEDHRALERAAMDGILSAYREALGEDYPPSAMQPRKPGIIARLLRR